MKKNAEESFAHSIKNSIQIFKQVWAVAPSRIIFSICLEIVDKAWDIYINVYFYLYLLNGLAEQRDFSYLLIFLIISTVLYLLLRFMYSFFKYNIQLQTDQKIYEHFGDIVYKKSTDVELAAFEDSGFYNLYTKACDTATTRPMAVIDNFVVLFSSAIAVIIIMVTLFQIDNFAILFVIFPLVAYPIFGKKLQKREYEKDMKNVDPNRMKDYVNRATYTSNYAKELRTTNIFKVLSTNFSNASAELVDNTKLYGIKIGLLRYALSLCNFTIPFFASSIYALYRISVSQTMDIGTYAVLSAVVMTLAGCVKQFSDSFLQLFSDNLYLNDLNKFLAYTPKISESQLGDEVKSFEKLEFKNVSFAYKEDSNFVVDDISFTIEAKQKIAIVGKNGAGKTTLVKLLLRLYDPTKGDVCVNGKNIRAYGVGDYRSLFGTVMQDAKIFALSIEDNILAGKTGDKESVKSALVDAGIFDKIETYPNGTNTVLTREFDDEGELLSGGEVQKIAIARMFAQNAPIAILDEPSSALDPLAEQELFERLLHFGNDKTVIFISHRLSSVTMADKIYFIEKNKIVESGSHKELMKLNGLYCEMFLTQAASYQDDTGEEDNYNEKH